MVNTEKTPPSVCNSPPTDSPHTLTACETPIPNSPTEYSDLCDMALETTLVSADASGNDQTDHMEVDYSTNTRNSIPQTKTSPICTEPYTSMALPATPQTAPIISGDTTPTPSSPLPNMSLPSTPLSTAPGASSSEIVVGSIVYVDVQKSTSDKRVYRQAEVLSIRTNVKTGSEEYYVHFINFNKRLDEWIDPGRIDLTRMSDNSSPRRKARLVLKGSSQEYDSPSPFSSPMTVNSIQSTPTPTFSKEKEIEKLRTSGSMTKCHFEIARVKNLERIHIGKHDVDTWYFSPFPSEFANASIVYICEFCLYNFMSERQFRRHLAKCEVIHPPGNEIYRDTNPNISFFEIDGARQKTYCRNLCLLSKLFLDHKTLYYDTDPFLFYIMCLRDAKGCHIIGYFSKEKDSTEGYNLACILTLPQYQRRGYGKLLISFSYELSKREGKIGTPEKPLSDLGLLSYRAYWTETLVESLLEANQSNDEVSIEELSIRTSIAVQDITTTLHYIGAIKTLKGQPVIMIPSSVLEAYYRNKEKHRSIIRPELLTEWKPPKFTPSQLRYY
ncbi:9393_t:CDS:1 [Paraglomus occultum]|uniref:histone acetyltransferase n=1 Tax=Paraglomus occultum TaxID=144539 RepID=A0A9N9F9P0_9GLOM|nr:9393_t:CDS:1 [Paraglomus occultum]